MKVTRLFATPGASFAARSILAVTAALLLPHFASAQSTWDDGAGDDLWSSFTNWSDDADPSGKTLTFNATGTAATAGTVTNIVNQNFTIGTLSTISRGRHSSTPRRSTTVSP